VAAQNKYPDVFNIDQKSRHWTGRFGPVTGITVTEIMKWRAAMPPVRANWLTFNTTDG
jgi:hypothetical protein